MELVSSRHYASSYATSCASSSFCFKNVQLCQIILMMIMLISWESVENTAVVISLAHFLSPCDKPTKISCNNFNKQRSQVTSSTFMSNLKICTYRRNIETNCNVCSLFSISQKNGIYMPTSFVKSRPNSNYLFLGCQKQDYSSEDLCKTCQTTFFSSIFAYF